jgi:hypothetical protein
LKTAAAVAAEYGVGRNTVRRDAAFAEALDKVAADCGDEVRQQVLSRVVRWTRGDVERLAKMDRVAAAEIVRVALAAGRRPRFPPRAEDEGVSRKSVNLPLGKATEQVRVLVNALGRKGLTRLHSAMARFLGKQERSRPG